MNKVFMTSGISSWFHRFLPTLLLLFSFQVFGQFGEHIRTGRPGQAIGPYSVGKNVLQIQSGIEYGKFNESNGNIVGNYLNQTNVIRFGITEYFEINTALGIRNEKFNLASDQYELTGFNSTVVGCRYNFLDGKNFVPSFGLQTSFKLPFQSSDFKSSYIAPKILLIGRQKITKNINTVINLGIEYDGFNPDPYMVYIICLNWSINKKTGLFIEGFGNLKYDASNSFFDFGFFYLINSNLQLDIYCGTGINNERKSYFGNLGVSWRISKWH